MVTLKIPQDWSHFFVQKYTKVKHFNKLFILKFLKAKIHV